MSNEEKIDNTLVLTEDKRYLFGLDISLKCTGVAIYDLEKCEFIHIESFDTSNLKASYEYKGFDLNSLKLKKLDEWFIDLIEKYPPEFASIERMFSAFPNETQVIAKATGVIQKSIWNVPQKMYPPKSVKLAIIHGNATKEQVRKEIIKRYPKLIMRNLDESDAVAVVICHLTKTGVLEWIKPELATKPAKKKKTPVKKKKAENTEE